MYSDAMANPMKLPELPAPPSLPLNGIAAAEALHQPPRPTLQNVTFRDIKRLLYSPVAAAKPSNTTKRQQTFNAWVSAFADPGPSVRQCYDWGQAQRPMIGEKKVRRLRTRCPDQRLRKRGRKSDED
jgi:hypothetical protein